MSQSKTHIFYRRGSIEAIYSPLGSRDNLVPGKALAEHQKANHLHPEDYTVRFLVKFKEGVNEEFEIDRWGPWLVSSNHVEHISIEEHIEI